MKRHTVVCSLHFNDEDLEKSNFSGRWKVIQGRLPSMFKCWGHRPSLLPSVSKKRKLNKLVRQKSEATCTNPTISHVITTEQEEIDDACGVVDDMNNTEPNDQCEILKLEESISQLNAEIIDLKEQLKFAQLKIDNLNKAVSKMEFSIENIQDKDVSFYTGFSSYKVFESVLNYLNPGAKGENLVYNRSEAIEELDDSLGDKMGRPRKLSPSNQFFLFLCRVRVGLFELDLSYRFKISIGTVSNIIISWSNFLYLRFGSLCIWPSKEDIIEHMPESFKQKYPNTRVIIDATEIKVEMPSSLMLKSQTYSNYKSTNTLKGLIGISPSGSVTFISQLYTGSISDKEITRRSGFLKLPFDKGDSVMADKGFEIADLLEPLGVKLNIPPFLHLQDQMTPEDVASTQQIAAERIHVERAINKVKNFHIFDQVIPMSLAGSINQIWTVCALLTLFQNPIIS